jgi:hypothetical protein
MTELPQAHRKCASKNRKISDGDERDDNGDG